MSELPGEGRRHLAVAEATPGWGGISLGRRDLLRYTALGAGLLAMPSLISGLGSETAHAAAATAGVTPDILRGATYPIGFWWPPPPQETTVARYAEIAEAGFTFAMGGNGVGNLGSNDAMLRAAAANDLPAIVVDDRISGIQAYPREQWPAVLEATLRDYQRYPAFAGFNVSDEPNAAAFGQLGAVNDLLRQYDPTKLGYVNLLPTYANSDQLGTATYQEHLDRYVAEARPEFLSFDHYALRGPSPGLRPDFFYNWALIRAKALQAGLPVWGFILACAHFDYRLPTEAELLWQINVGLAYGAKGIQYFTYWTPDPPQVFREALVSREGALLPLYYAAQRINNDYLRSVGAQLLHLTSESVTHFGEAEPPMGVEPFTGDEWIASANGSPAILSRFHNGRSAGRRWLLVTNRSFDSQAATTLTLSPAVGAVFEFDTSRNRFVPARLDSAPGGRGVDVGLAPGAARLYRLHTAD